jgi:hypothetical protein
MPMLNYMGAVPGPDGTPTMPEGVPGVGGPGDPTLTPGQSGGGFPAIPEGPAGPPMAPTPQAPPPAPTAAPSGAGGPPAGYGVVTGPDGKTYLFKQQADFSMIFYMQNPDGSVGPAVKIAKSPLGGPKAQRGPGI